MKIQNDSHLRRFVILGLGFLITFQPCWPTFLAAQVLTAQDFFQQGRQKYLITDNRGALKDAQAALGLDPHDWRAYQLAGYASYKMGDKDSAADYCRKSLFLHRDNPVLQAFLDKHFSAVGETAPLPEGLRKQAAVTPAADLDWERAEGRQQARLDIQGIATAGDFAGGFAAGFFLTPVMGVAGALGGAQLTYSPTGGFINLSALPGAFLGAVAGCLLGSIGSSAVVSGAVGEPVPDLSKVRGRSADYQSSYQNEFKKMGKKKKQDQVGNGGLVGALLSIPAAILVIKSRR